MIKSLIEQLTAFGIEFKLEQPLSKHTSFKIGGNCRILVMPKAEQEIATTIVACRELQIPYLVLGNGSNVLVSDHGFNGAVIALGNRFSKIWLAEETLLFAQSGASLSKVCQEAQKHGLTGLEFAYGIPASVGGAVYMNAGAYGGETKDRLVAVEYVDDQGNQCRCEGDKLDMSYRHSFFSGKPYCITGAYFQLKKGDSQAIQTVMDDIYHRRKTKQPLEYPSAGSTFKRPEGAYASKLIEDCGLKGRSVGGAQVSEKHSGFVINKGGATCQDVLDLIAVIQKEVKQQTGFSLDCEVRRIPESLE